MNLGICIFDPAHWGHGIGYIALGVWTQYIFDELPEIVRLGMRTWSGNVGMVRLAEKLGFQEEMRLRQARIVNGDYFDAVGFGVLRQEWESHYPGGFAESR
ncbi:MAG: GNAT family N-acetyltransferase [Caldilineaceae bacterium]|nr:GNAT family N-acetyltransferase [Caldilineaceae bacterium]